MGGCYDLQWAHPSAGPSLETELAGELRVSHFPFLNTSRFPVHSLFQSAETSSAPPLWAPLLRGSVSGPGSINNQLSDRTQIGLLAQPRFILDCRIYPQLTSVTGLVVGASVGSSVVMHSPTYATLTPAEFASHSFG